MGLITLRAQIILTPQQQTIQQPQLNDADQQLPSANGNYGNEQQAPQRTSRYGRCVNCLKFYVHVFRPIINNGLSEI